MYVYIKYIILYIYILLKNKVKYTRNALNAIINILYIISYVGKCVITEICMSKDYSLKLPS